MTAIRRTAICLLALGAGALAFAPPVPSGTVHFYRHLLKVGKAAHPIISCDAFPIARMQNGRVYTMQIPAGRHAIATSENPTGIEIDIEAGKEYFIRIDYATNASFAIRATPVVVPVEVGREETKKLRPLDGWLVEDATCGK
jgi:Protein of unknown function (DUF2846)